MFEYNGETFSLDLIEEKAKQLGFTLEEYLNKNPEIKKVEEVKTTPVETDAAAGEEIASDTVSSLENGSLDSQENESFKPQFSKTGQILNKPKVEKIGDDKDFESYNALTENLDGFLATAVRGLGKLASVPQFMQKANFALARLFIDDEELEKFDDLPYEEQNQLIMNINAAQRGSLGGLNQAVKKGYEANKVAIEKAEELESSFTQFDNTIGQAFAQGNIGEASARAVGEAFKSIPFMLEAMVPYVGIPMIVAQEASGA
mgnify:FL=1